MRKEKTNNKHICMQTDIPWEIRGYFESINMAKNEKKKLITDIYVYRQTST